MPPRRPHRAGLLDAGGVRRRDAPHGGAPRPPAVGLASPARWGTRAGLDDLLGPQVRAARVEPRTFTFRYRSADHFIEVFRTFYGPVHRAYAALQPVGQAALTADLAALLERHDTGHGGGLVVPGTYLEAVLTRA